MGVAVGRDPQAPGESSFPLSQAGPQAFWRSRSAVDVVYLGMDTPPESKRTIKRAPHREERGRLRSRARATRRIQPRDRGDTGKTRGVFLEQGRACGSRR